MPPGCEISAASGAAGVLAWHQGWPHLPTALAQKGAPSGQMTWAIHVTIAPTWFDPAEPPGIITPFMFLYALHDALVKPMPDGYHHVTPYLVVPGVATLLDFLLSAAAVGPTAIAAGMITLFACVPR